VLTVTRGLSDAVVAKVAQTVYAVLHMCSTLFCCLFRLLSNLSLAIIA